MRTWAIVAVLALAGCGTPHPERGLADLMLEEADGGVTRYLDAIGGQRAVSATVPDLPLYRAWAGHLTGEMAWLAAYDLDGNDTVDRAEMTQGWLVKAAELKTGHVYGPQSLKAAGPVAAAGPGLQAVTLRGVYLSLPDRQIVRAALEETDEGAALLAAIKLMAESGGCTFGDCVGTGGDSNGNGGGSSSGGGSSGGGGGGGPGGGPGGGGGT